MDRSVVARATSSDESPTPAYLFGEIAQMTHANFEGCRQLTVYLLERIKKPNHNIKFKCLQIIKHVCLKGRSDFKIVIARDAQVIKDCLTFSGPPDPLRGEEIYRKIREAAKETLDAVFAETPPSGMNTHNRYASGNRIEGFGSGATDGFGGGGSYGGGGMYDRGGGGYGSSSRDGGGGAAGSSSGIGSVGSAMGAAVGKAMGSLRGRSGRDVGLVSGGAGGEYGGGGGYGRGGGYMGGGAGAGRGASMQGMGNYDPSKDKTWLERTSDSVRGSVGTGIDAVSRRFGRGGSGVDSRYVSHNGGDDRFSASSYVSNRGPNSYDGPGYRPEVVSNAYETARANSQAYASHWNQGGSSSGPASAGSGVRGGWANDKDSRGGIGAGGGGVTPGQFENPDTAGSYGGGGYATGGEGHGFVGRTGGGDADGGYEGKLVEEICAAGGTKSTPAKPELDAFLSKAASLDPGRVADALVSVLGAADWRARNKGLAVVEALHRSNPSYRIPLEDAFQDSERGVIPLCSDSKPAVRDRAVRVSKLLGLEAQAQDQGQGQASEESESKSTTTTTNGYSRAPDGEPGQTTAAPSGPPVDLLGGIDTDQEGGKGGGIEGVPVPGKAVGMVDLLDDGGGAGGAGAGGGAAGSGLDDFLGLGLGGGGADAKDATRTTAVAVAAAVASSSDDVTEPAESLFGGLSVKEAGADGGEEDDGGGPAPVLASRGASGFAFIVSAEKTSPDDAAPAGGPGDDATAGVAGSGAEMKRSAGSARGGTGGSDLLSGFGGDEKVSPSGTGGGLDMLVMSPPQRDAEGGQDVRRKKPTAGDDLLSLDPLSGRGNRGVTNGNASTRDGKGVSTNSSGGSLLDWAAAGGTGAGGEGKEGKKGSADDGGRVGSGTMDRNQMLQEKVMRMQQQQQKMLQGGVFGTPGAPTNIPAVGLGAGVPMPVMYPSGVLVGQQRVDLGSSTGVGLMRQPGATGPVKTIPDPLTWGGSSSGQRGAPLQRKGGVMEAAAEGGQKAPDSFSFVRDAMQDSIK